MLLWVMSVGFKNTRTVSKQWNLSRIFSRLCESDYNMLRVSLVVAKHCVVVATAG